MVGGMAAILVASACTGPNNVSEPATSGDLTLTVMEVRCGAAVSDGRRTLVPNGQFCRLSVTIRNDGSSRVTVADSWITVTDARGQMYGASPATTAVDGSVFARAVGPRAKIVGISYFDIPKDSRLVSADFKGSDSAPAVEVPLP